VRRKDDFDKDERSIRAKEQAAWIVRSDQCLCVFAFFLTISLIGIPSQSICTAPCEVPGQPTLMTRPCSPNTTLMIRPCSPNTTFMTRPCSPNTTLMTRPCSPNTTLMTRPCSPNTSLPQIAAPLRAEPRSQQICAHDSLIGKAW